MYATIDERLERGLREARLAARTGRTARRSGAVSGWVIQPPPAGDVAQDQARTAVLELAAPERSHSASTVRRSTSSACASTEAVSGSSETKNSASRARVSPPRRLGSSRVIVGFRHSTPPRSLRTSAPAEARPSLHGTARGCARNRTTTWIRSGQSATRSRNVAGPPNPSIRSADGRHRLLDRVADRRDVGEVERRGRPQELGRQREPGPRRRSSPSGPGYRCENSGPGPTSRAKKPASSSRRRASSTATLRNAASSMLRAYARSGDAPEQVLLVLLGVSRASAGRPSAPAASRRSPGTTSPPPGSTPPPPSRTPGTRR